MRNGRIRKESMRLDRSNTGSRRTTQCRGTATWYVPSEVAGGKETSMTSRGSSGRPLIEKPFCDLENQR